MDDLAWERCPDCLGLLDAIDVVGGVALSCTACGFTGEAVPVPPLARLEDADLLHLPSF